MFLESDERARIGHRSNRKCCSMESRVCAADRSESQPATVAAWIGGT
jgi:hypothetical protein